MWSRLSNLAQNVQTGLDTVVDNVNKSMTEEEAAAAAAATEEVKNTCTVHRDKKKESPYSLGHSKYYVVMEFVVKSAISKSSQILG